MRTSPKPATIATLPDIITSAKGLTSGYSPLGAVLVSDRIMEPFLTGEASFAHGITFGGHPVSCAVALANLDLFERDDLCGHVLAHQDEFRSTLENLRDIGIVGDATALPDAWELLADFRRELDELSALVNTERSSD